LESSPTSRQNRSALGGKASPLSHHVISHLPVLQVISKTDPAISSKLSVHTSAYPRESTSIPDSATSLGGKSQIPDPSRTFIPVGHISLDSENEDPNAADPSRGIYRISSFYISRALQSLGLGRAAMDEVERMATSEPLNAKTLTLGTVANEYEGKKEMWEAMREEGRDEPKVSG
jgi:Acetyltransferase (GNAT) family